MCGAAEFQRRCRAAKGEVIHCQITRRDALEITFSDYDYDHTKHARVETATYYSCTMSKNDSRSATHSSFLSRFSANTVIHSDPMNSNISKKS